MTGRTTRPRANDSNTNLQQVLFDSLNEHGFLFQEKCAEVLRNAGHETNWIVHVQEYPVSVGERDSRIDIVMREDKDGSRQLYAVVECKRINPDGGCWLFGTPLGTYSQPLLIGLDGGYAKVGSYSIRYRQLKLHFDDIASHLIDNWWLDINGRSNKSSPNPIEDAFRQVCLGVSGIAQEMELQCRKDPQDIKASFIPVVITTAPLYVASYEADKIDLASGSISIDQVCFGNGDEREPSKTKWLMVDYPASKSLSPDDLYRDVRGISPVELEEIHKRTIFVVNSKHIVEFFRRLHDV